MIKAEIKEKIIDGRPMYKIEFNLTRGEMLALNHLVQMATTPHQEDVKSFWKNALARAGYCF